MHTQPSASFGVLLRHYRQRAALTQEALAEQAGLTPNAISALERGERRHPYPTPVQAIASARCLGAEQRDLLLRLAQTKAEGLPTIPPYALSEGRFGYGQQQLIGVGLLLPALQTTTSAHAEADGLLRFQGALALP